MTLGFSEMVNNIPTNFKEKILEGKKIHTVRQDSSGRWQVGKLIHFATGVRTKNYHCFAISKVESIKPVRIIIKNNKIEAIASCFDYLDVAEFIKNDGLENPSVLEFFIEVWKSKSELKDGYHIYSGKLISWRLGVKR